MMNTYRYLTEDEQKTLDKLNADVAAAIAKRRDWLDAKMHECSRLQVGDDIYDIDTGRRLGVVSELYRYWRDRDEGVRDHSLEVNYRFETSPRCFDNTSRYGWSRSFGTREDAIARAEERAERIRAGLT